MCEPCGREKQLRDAIVKALSDGKKLIFVFAPTGYGKTRVSPYLLHAAREKGLASRLIHVVPTRALVKEIYEEKFKEPAEKCGIHAAYQSLDRLCEGIKSPYFLAELVVTTLESFILNAFKLPPAEFAKVVRHSTEGHYYPSMLALLSSIVVFDEAHLYIAEAKGKPVTLVVAAARALLEMNVPVIILTATMPVVQFENMWKALKVRMDDVKVLYVCPAPGSCKQVEKMKKGGYDVEEIQDDPQRFNKIEWETRIMSYRDALRRAKEKCQNELVLWVSSTVDGAVRAFDQLDGCERILIHGKLSELDKEAAIKKMEELRGVGERGDNHSSPCASEKSMKELEGELAERAARERKGIIVASPIAEVGLDVDATTLISEAASMESLVQRAGRLYRKKSKGKAEVIVIEPEEEEKKEEKKSTGKSRESEEEKMKRVIKKVIEEIKNHLKQGPTAIDWRSPAALGGRISYIELMENLTAEKRREDHLEDHREDEKREEDYSLKTSYAELFKGIVMFDSRPRQALEIFSSAPLARKDHGAFHYGLSLVKVKVGEKERDNTMCPSLPRLHIDYVIVSTTDLKRDWVKWEKDMKEVEVEAIVRYSDTKEEKKETFYSAKLANVLLSGKERGRSMNIRDIEKIMKELTKRAEEKLEREGRKDAHLTIIDYFLVAREGAYSPGRGLGVDETPRR